MLTDVYMQKAINGNSTSYCSKEEVKLWYGKKGHSNNCYAEEHKNEEIAFFLVSIKSCCKRFESINKDTKNSLSAFVWLYSLVECKTTINVSQSNQALPHNT